MGRSAGGRASLPGPFGQQLMNGRMNWQARTGALKDDTSNTAAAIMVAPASRWLTPPTAIARGLLRSRSTGVPAKMCRSTIAIVGTFYFPRAIHHGHGVFQPIIDERANDTQREALFYIMSGEDQPVGTMFQIFSVIIETIKDPIFTKIGFEWDLEKRTAKIEVADVVRARSEPIRNPVTDREHRMLTVLPDGWVFHEAENASGFAKGLGTIKFDLNRRHSSLAHVAWNQNGLAYKYDEYKQKFGRP